MARRALGDTAAAGVEPVVAEPVAARYRREGDPGGPPEAFWDPDRQAVGHLDAAGAWVQHEIPPGYHYVDGVLIAIEERANG